VIVVIPQNFSEELVLCVMYRLYNILVISGEVKEASALARGTEFRKDIFSSQGHEIVGGVETKQ
jgi:hypothetical protein